MAVFQFLFSMWTVIWSYQPDPLSTLAFAAMAALGAVSMLATWLLGLAAVGVTGVYTVIKLAETAQVKRNVHRNASFLFFPCTIPLGDVVFSLDETAQVKQDALHMTSDFFFFVVCVFSKVMSRQINATFMLSWSRPHLDRQGMLAWVPRNQEILISVLSRWGCLGTSGGR